MSMAAVDAAQGRPTMFTSHKIEISDIHPNPGYYALLPVTLPVDIVATPIILIVLSRQDWAP